MFRLVTGRGSQVPSSLALFRITRKSHVDIRKANVSPSHCLKCSAPLPTCLPACPECGHISTLPMNTTYHKMFGLPYEPSPFSVNLPLLKQRFRTAQGVCHPDTWASQGDEKKRMAEDLSAKINEAYQTLLRPLSRVEYILKRHGHELTDAEGMGAKKPTDGDEQDMSFLNDVMEARMEIEAADPSVLEDIRVVERINEENRDKIQDTVKALDSLLTLNEPETSNSLRWNVVRRIAIHLRYLESIEKAAKDWLERVELMPLVTET